jgi:SAM-dependent methyltransferase
MNNKINIFIFSLLCVLGLLFDFFPLITLNSKTKLNENFKSIEELYGPESFIAVDNNKKGEQYNLTYGELTSEGVEKIVKYLESKKINPNTRTFIDLGCGNGKALVYAIINGFIQANGTEIVEERYEFAEKKKQELEDKIKEKINITNADIFDLPQNYFPPNSVIFVSNLLFPDKTNQKLINFLSNNTSADNIIIVSKIPNNLYKLKLIEKINVPMSWARHSECYVLSH